MTSQRKKAAHDLFNLGWAPEEIAGVLKVGRATVYRDLGRLRSESERARKEWRDFDAACRTYGLELSGTCSS